MDAGGRNVKLVTNLHLVPQSRMRRAYFYPCICHLHPHASVCNQPTLSHTSSHPLTLMFGFRLRVVSKYNAQSLTIAIQRDPNTCPLMYVPPPPHTHTQTHTYFFYFNVYNGIFVIRACAVLPSVPSNLSDSSRPHSTASHAILNPNDINFPVKCLA
jgi:hypothetical protein